MPNLKRTIRDAAIALLDAQTDAATVRAFTDVPLRPDQLNAILVSVSFDTTETAPVVGAVDLLVSITLRFVGMSSREIDATSNVIDDLDDLEAQCIRLLDRGRNENPDPLGIGAKDMYFSGNEEPVLNDDHEELVAIIESTFGLYVRVSPDDLTTIV